MIKLYRTADCKTCDEFEEKLKDMVIAHQIILVKAATDLKETPLELQDLPALIENQEIHKGSEAVLNQIKKLEKIKSDWDLIQGDSCYCGPDGEII